MSSAHAIRENDIGYLLNKVTRQLRLRLAERLGPLGLTPQQGAALMAVATSPDARLTPSALSETIGTDAATTSGLIGRMTRDGWFESEPNENDARSRFIVASRKARAALPSVLEAAQAVSVEATACLTGAEAQTLVGLLGRVSASLDEASTVGESR